MNNGGNLSLGLIRALFRSDLDFGVMTGHNAKIKACVDRTASD